MYFIGTSIIKNGEITSLSEQEETGIDNELYELIRVQNKKPVFLKEHLTRFKNTLNGHNISLEYIDKLPGLIEWLTLCNPQSDCDLRLVVSPKGLFQAGFVTSHYPTKQMYETGVKVDILKAIRNNPKAKIYHADMRADAQRQQEKNGTYESLLVNPEGLITEGSRSNVYFIREGEIYNTPDNMVLGGIMRMKVIDICRSLGIKINNTPVNLKDISQYDAAFLSSTPMRIIPICDIEGTMFNQDDTTLRRIMSELDNEISKQIR
ncbi:MAG: aminotransferase class IV [Bacteroidales bacterium]|nr:aminotransferase class IV [Bacteroidales bacterium]